MGSASWTLSVLLVLGATFGVEPQGRASGRLSARWVGQDGHDYVGPNDKLGPSEIQDIHIAIAGLDPARDVVFLEVSSSNGVWRFAEKPAGWRAHLKREKAAAPATSSSSRHGSKPASHFMFLSVMTTDRPRRPTCAAAKPTISCE